MLVIVICEIILMGIVFAVQSMPVGNGDVATGLYDTQFVCGAVEFIQRIE